jgi:hypothetical protein
MTESKAIKNAKKKVEKARLALEKAEFELATLELMEKEKTDAAGLSEEDDDEYDLGLAEDMKEAMMNGDDFEDDEYE